MESSPDLLVIICTHCGHRGTTVDHRVAGQKVRCKACQGVFRAPEVVTLVEEPVPAPPTQSSTGARSAKLNPGRSLDDLFNDPEVIEALAAPPFPAARTYPSGVPDAPFTRACPYCAELILPAAIKCKHCGEWLDASKAPAAARTSAAPQVVIHNNNHVNSHAGAAIDVRGDGSHLVAALLWFFMPGLGQLVRGQLLGAMAWFFVTVVAYVMLLPVGFVVHVLCVVMAAQPGRR